MSSVRNVPYERWVQWLAGPVSIIAGYLATQLTTHIGLFGNLGITKDQTARAIVTVGTFSVAALVTYAGHHKWLANLPLWWAHETASPVVSAIVAEADAKLPAQQRSSTTPPSYSPPAQDR
jgi:hypothetical protein